VAATPSTPSPPPPPTSTPTDDAATKAAGSALLGRLRGRKGDTGTAAEPTIVSAPAEPAPADEVADATTEIPVTGGASEDADGFPIAGYDQLRATELLAQLPALDRNQLEAVRQRESSGKNRFTIMSRVDSLLATKAEPAWDAADDSWEDDTDAGTAASVDDDQAALDADLAMDSDDEWTVGDDEVDELVSPSAESAFPIAGYDALTVGQILPRLSELDAGELAAVRAREAQGRNRGTILDRVDRLSARAGGRAGSGAMAMPAAGPAPAPARTTRKAAAAKATAPVSKTTAPAVKKTRAAKAAPVPEPVKATTRKAPARAAAAATPVRKAAGRKAAPVTPAPPVAAPMKEAVKKARAAKKTTKRP
jgi:hypothetical protein